MPAPGLPLRGTVIGAAVALMLALQVAAVTLTGAAAERSALAVASDAIAREGATTVEAILRHLDPAEQSVEVTARLVAADLLDLTDPALERYLYTQLAVMPPMTGIFVGFPDGSFVFVSREDDGFRTKRITTDGGRTVDVTHLDPSFDELSSERTDEDPYDPRDRPWYALASASDGVVWTEPYVFFTSGRPGVTASQAVRGPDGELLAVVGVDVELSGLTAFIDDLAVSANGEAFVVSGDTVVAAPSRYADQSAVTRTGELRLLTTAELGVDGLVAASTRAAGTTTVRSGEGDQLVLSRSFPAEQGLTWTTVIRAPRSDFTEPLRQQQRSLQIIWGLGVLGLAAAAVVMARVTRPLGRLQDEASVDHLTGVANRRALMAGGTRLMAQATRRRQPVAVVLLDLDDFKAVNDELGHAVGDRTLAAVGGALRDLCRPTDLVGRLGGDEFVVVGAVDDETSALALAERLVDGLGDVLREVAGSVDGVGATAGVCVSTGTDLAGMLSRADAALLARKAAAKGGVGLCAQA